MIKEIQKQFKHNLVFLYDIKAFLRLKSFFFLLHLIKEMATSASPTVSTEASPTIAVNPSPNLSISPATLFNKLPHQVTAQLTRDNYLTWQWQMVTYLKSQNAYGFVEGTVHPPPQTIPNPSPTADSPATIANPAFLTWLQHDQMVLSTLVSTISENLISQVIGYSTSFEVWNALERMYSSQSRAQIIQVHYQLATLDVQILILVCTIVYVQVRDCIHRELCCKN